MPIAAKPGCGSVTALTIETNLAVFPGMDLLEVYCQKESRSSYEVGYMELCWWGWLPLSAQTLSSREGVEVNLSPKHYRICFHSTSSGSGSCLVECSSPTRLHCQPHVMYALKLPECLGTCLVLRGGGRGRNVVWCFSVKIISQVLLYSNYPDFIVSRCLCAVYQRWLPLSNTIAGLYYFAIRGTNSLWLKRKKKCFFVCLFFCFI